MSFEGPEETRGARVLVPDIFHIIWFWEAYAISRSVIHHFLSPKARFERILVSFEGSKETSGARGCVLQIFHIIWFLGGYAVSQ
jgi:hypothetical protein